MSFQITKGLFKFDFTDQHAILGVPVDAEFNDIRKRYMKIARRLHSDTCPFESQAEKNQANEFLSKVVNPAYNKFSKESERKEYSLLLSAIAKRTVKEQKHLQIEGAAAKKLLTANDYQEAYKKALTELAENQYESIANTLEIIAQISELNMVYLLRKELKGSAASQPQPAAAPAGKPAAAPAATSAGKPAAASAGKPAAAPAADKPADKPAAAPPPKTQDAFVEQACRRVEGLISNKNYAKAILELKEALKRDPKHSKGHALLGLCYLEQKQATMAKIESKKALELNPQEPTALEASKKLEQSTAQTAKTKAAAEKPSFFGGLFGGGGKKK
jgi:curved DNA-binding protein CbpA